MATSILSGGLKKNPTTDDPKGGRFLKLKCVYVIIKMKGSNSSFFGRRLITELKEGFGLTAARLGEHRGTAFADLHFLSGPLEGGVRVQVPPHVWLGSGRGSESPLVGRWVKGSSRTGPGQLRNIHRL